MISAWHLLWIIPLSACAGVFCMALVSAKRCCAQPDSGYDPDYYDHDVSGLLEED